uniref:Glycoside Hydrolase Family 55 n=1 Tax=Podospora anserina (strain S / ATCC MYA-4624 / DSM 980 / FGSC 10383) TaxID=515849 RepID=A0A090CFN9_PODAN|nr:Putative Glycoside Hydrolase Family 55 [Podospora anserina S mat+]
MVDNQKNYYGVAPDKGKQNGPVWRYSESFAKYMSNLRANKVIRGGYGKGLTPGAGDRPQNHLNGTLGSNSTLYLNNTRTLLSRGSAPLHKRASDYWLTTLGPLGIQPHAGGSNYKFYRDVVADYGADNTGESDASEAINAAVEDGNRCGLECGNTFTQGAIIYFPPGTYKICSPVVQLYYSQFIGDPHDPPTIKGCRSFKGIALFDADPYIPGGGGQNWYINQNQFFRQIRNFIFDLTEMPISTADNDQPLVPTGIHWQVSQATSLENLVFNMPKATDDETTTAVGIFTENGSGGFVADLTFNGGAIGWRAGSQQYTARNLKFNGCLTAVQMIWDWGFNWQGIEVKDSAIAFNISGRGGATGQGIGSISVIDSSITNTPIGILTNSHEQSPNIVLDNVKISNVAQVVQVDNGPSLLSGTSDTATIDLWAHGRRYNGDKGSSETGPVKAPSKAAGLLGDDKKLFTKSRPQYADFSPENFLVATKEGIKNDGTGDQTLAINAFLLKAKANSQIAYFPAGIYQVGGTVFIPTGSRVVGSSWSQIQGSGFYFADMNAPRVMVRVGNRGDLGTMEITDMLFTVKGATAGAILVEWNVAGDEQGAAGMWDSHVRVGGGIGTDLDIDNCPKGGFNDQCICASMLLHVTAQASGYFENVWVWVADHDNDMVVYDSPDKLINQISLYAARCTLIESQEPTWFYGTGSEHCVMYQYQLNKAKNVYLGHIQSETPYYQPNPVAPYPFDGARPMAADPSFLECTTDSCKAGWGLRIIDSENITIHGSGLYSFFQDYYQDCLETFDCQDKILEVKGSKNVAIFNLFTVGTVNIASATRISLGMNLTNGKSNSSATQQEGNISRLTRDSGFTTEVSVWLPLDGSDNISVVYVGPEIWDRPTAACSPPCVLVLPTSTLGQDTTISPSEYTTSLEYGRQGSSTGPGGQVITTFYTTTTTITITVPPITIPKNSGLPYSNVNVTRGQGGGGFIATPRVEIPPIGVPLPDGNGGTTTRQVFLPPWPDVNRGPPEDWEYDGPWGNPSPIPSGGVGQAFHTPWSTIVTASAATVTTLTFPAIVHPQTYQCPPSSEISFNTPRMTLTVDCPTPTEFKFGFSCPTTKVVTFLGPSAGVFTVDCTVSSVWDFPRFPEPTPGPSESTTSDEPLPVWTTWPPGEITPVEREVEESEPEDDGTFTSCKLWFFFFCIRWDNIKIGGWKWTLPPGIYPPGPPPPFIKFPFKVEGTLPPWPEITIGRDRKLTYSNEPTSCTTKSASLCTTTTIFSVTKIAEDSTRTTATATSRQCETVRGCDVTDQNTRTVSTAIESCTPKPRVKARDGDDPSLLNPRQNGNGNSCGKNAIVYPKDPKSAGDIPSLLSAYAGKYETIGVPELNIVGYWWVPLLDEETMKRLKSSPFVNDAYYYQDWNNAGNGPDRSGNINGEMALPAHSEGITHDDDGWTSLASPLFKRARTTTATNFWASSIVSLPKGWNWREAGTDSYDYSNLANPYLYQWDDQGGSTEHTIYVTGEARVWTDHPEFKASEGFQGELDIVLPGGKYDVENDKADAFHGTCVAAYAIGAKLGICKKCRGVWFETKLWSTDDPYFNPNFVRERGIAHLMAAFRDIHLRGNAKKAVINMSWSYPPGRAIPATLQSTHWVLTELDKMGVVLVASSGNHAHDEGREISRFPARFASSDKKRNPYGEIKNLIVVGATQNIGIEYTRGQTSNYMTTFAPGENVPCTSDPNAAGDKYSRNMASGTSAAAPQVAGLAAYWRSLPSKWQTQLEEPANVKKLIRLFHRRYGFWNAQRAKNFPILAQSKPVIWNGQVKDKNCLVDYDTRQTWDTTKACPDIPDRLSTLPENPGESVNCNNPAPPPNSKRQAGSGGSCPFTPGGSGAEKSIDYQPKPTPSPTCQSNNCGGKLCTGFFCRPKPSGIPPDYMDPKDPNAGNPVPVTHIPGPNKPTTTRGGGGTPTPSPECDDKCKLDRGNPCRCGDTGCDEQSPACCHNASCPKCDCPKNGDGCSKNSPACCASGTCQWQYTGGGGGLEPNPVDEPDSGANRVASPPSSTETVTEDPEHVDAVYEIYSERDAKGGFVVSGFSGDVNGTVVGMGGVEPDWVMSGNGTSGLETSYKGVVAYGRRCDFLAGSVNGYEGMERPGMVVGALTCEGVAPAVCVRGEGGGEVREELVCRWE